MVPSLLATFSLDVVLPSFTLKVYINYISIYEIKLGVFTYTNTLHWYQFLPRDVSIHAVASICVHLYHWGCPKWSAWYVYFKAWYENKSNGCHFQEFHCQKNIQNRLIIFNFLLFSQYVIQLYNTWWLLLLHSKIKNSICQAKLRENMRMTLFNHSCRVKLRRHIFIFSSQKLCRNEIR